MPFRYEPLLEAMTKLGYGATISFLHWPELLVIQQLEKVHTM